MVTDVGSGCRLRELGENPEERRKTVSGVVEYRPYADGTLQAEVRRYHRKDRSVKEQGPYWYFRLHEGGRQKKIYLGRTDDPENESVRKRARPTPGSPKQWGDAWRNDLPDG